MPQGLEYLASVDQLIIKQKVEVLEAVIGFETQNKYTVFNTMGQQARSHSILAHLCLYKTISTSRLRFRLLFFVS